MNTRFEFVGYQDISDECFGTRAVIKIGDDPLDELVIFDSFDGILPEHRAVIERMVLCAQAMHGVPDDELRKMVAKS